MKPEFKNASESFKRLNGHLFGLGSLGTFVNEPKQQRALERQTSPNQSRNQSMGRSRGRKSERILRITLLRFGKTEWDSDNLIAGLKPLRDTVAQWFFGGTRGQHDGDKKIEWIYGQVKTTGQRGVLVKAEPQVVR